MMTDITPPAKVKQVANWIASIGNDVDVTELESSYADFSVWSINFKSIERHAMLSTAGTVWFIETRSPRRSTRFDGAQLEHLSGTEKMTNYTDLRITIEAYTTETNHGSGTVGYRVRN